jgi:hypothetical protein
MDLACTRRKEPYWMHYRPHRQLKMLACCLGWIAFRGGRSLPAFHPPQLIDEASWLWSGMLSYALPRVEGLSENSNSEAVPHISHQNTATKTLTPDFQDGRRRGIEIKERNSATVIGQQEAETCRYRFLRFSSAWTEATFPGIPRILN